jgi:hypothetical protein
MSVAVSVPISGRRILESELPYKAPVPNVDRAVCEVRTPTHRHDTLQIPEGSSPPPAGRLIESTADR